MKNAPAPAPAHVAQPIPTLAPTIDHAKVAQEMADVTGLGAKYIADQLNDADAWDAAVELLKMGASDEIRELINPRNKAV